MGNAKTRCGGFVALMIVSGCTSTDVSFAIPPECNHTPQQPPGMVMGGPKSSSGVPAVTDACAAAMQRAREAEKVR